MALQPIVHKGRHKGIHPCAAENERDFRMMTKTESRRYHGQAGTSRPIVPISPARRRRSSGTVIVESVFTILPTLALILAFVDFSLMLFRRSTLQNAVREGCRYAVTFQTAAGLGQDASIENVVQKYAMNFVTTTDSPQ